MARSDYNTGQSNTVIYSDFLTNLNPHPVSKETLRLTNEDAVNRSIRNLLFTIPGERYYQPRLGSKLRELLFEDVSETTSNVLRQTIASTIDGFEPRCKLITVDVEGIPDRNAYNVSIIYALINKQDPIRFNVTLKRLR